VAVSAGIAGGRSLSFFVKNSPSDGQAASRLLITGLDPKARRMPADLEAATTRNGSFLAQARRWIKTV